MLSKDEANVLGILNQSSFWGDFFLLLYNCMQMAGRYQVKAVINLKGLRLQVQYNHAHNLQITTKHVMDLNPALYRIS